MKRIRIFTFSLIFVLGYINSPAQLIADFEFDDTSNMPTSLLKNKVGANAISINPNVRSNGEGLYSIQGEDFQLRIPKSIFAGAESITLQFDIKQQEFYSGLLYGGFGKFRLGYQKGLGFRVVYFTQNSPKKPIESGFVGAMEEDERAILTFMYDKETGIAQLIKNTEVIWETPAASQTPGQAFHWDLANDTLIVGFHMGEEGTKTPSLYFFKAYATSCGGTIDKPTVIGAERCGSGPLTLKASGGQDGNYRWYTSATTNQPIAGAVNSEYTPSELAESSTFYVSLMAGACESERVPVEATVHSLPAPPVVESAERCGAGTVTIKTTGTSEGIYRWYYTADSQTPIANATGSSYTTSFLTQTTDFYVASFNGVCESERVKVQAIIKNPPIAPTVNTATICGEGDVELSIVPENGMRYRWFSSTTADPISEEDKGEFIAYVKSDTTFYVCAYNGNCESEKVTIEVIHNAPPQLYAGEDKKILGNGSVQLLAHGNFQRLNWHPTEGLSNPTVSNPIASPRRTTTYTVTGVNEEGCEVSDDITVFVLDDFPIPNAFSPNSDGRNDTWDIPLLDEYPNCEVFIFNRWGNVVFHSKGAYVPWDGSTPSNEASQPGTYIYKIDLGNGAAPIQGTLMLMR